MKRKRSDKPHARAGKVKRGPTTFKQTGVIVPFRGTSNAAIAKYTSPGFRRGEEVKTLDIQFTGAYNAVYTADTQPAQILNLNNGTACVQSLNLIQQGNGISQRIGNKISLKSCRLRLRFVQNTSNSDTVTHARVMLLYDRNPNTAYAAANTILGESLQSNTIGTGTMDSNINPNFFDRFVVLMDKHLVLPPLNSSAGGISVLAYTNGPSENNTFKLEEFIKLRNLECQYNGSANPMTIAQQNIGSLQILCFGDTAAATQAWSMTGTARIRFRDN